MNFQAQLRKNFMTFSIKLIFIIFILFFSITLSITYVKKNIQKQESINILDNSFQDLLKKFYSQIEYHNSNIEYINAIEDRTINNKIVSSFNYSFSQKMNLRYTYNIYDENLDAIYEENLYSTLRYKMYLEIIRERINNNNPLKFIMYSDLKTNDSSLIFYNGLYKNDKLIAIDTFLIDINDLSYYLLPNIGNYIITNEFDSVIASNNFEILNSGLTFKYSKDYTLNGIKYKVTSVKKDYYTIYYLEEKFSIENYYYAIIFLILTLVLLVIFFSNIAIRKIAKKNSESIESIINDTSFVSRGKLNHRINENVEDDFRYLAKNINIMLDKLNSEIELNKQLSETNLIFEKRKLDSQFDPHFLYNSLETIRYSMLFGVKETEKYILELNSILRYSITNKINYATLKDDFIYLKKYLDLDKFRFKDKLTYNINISPDTFDIQVPKLAIQPLVGNSVKYGFMGCRKVHIDISTQMIDNVYYIRVHDNGVSISNQVINEIMESCSKDTNPTNHIGIHNVLRRFMILYPDSKLNIKRDNNGTEFEISFTKEVGNNV